ncbi:MAG TPA: NAD(P)H-quinone oxidoreductase [Woeseiaceae bacterium]|nr:NAD(P)H-quinone oxidoreductase [Woeseiaceae bacterium]
MLPRDMKAVGIAHPGGPEVLELVSMPVPAPRHGEVLIRVAAAGVNRPDILQRLGRYPVPPDADPLPGLEVAGEIVASGENTGRFRAGDRVMALTHGGGYAEYCRVHESHCLPVPAGFSPAMAAAVPETFFTVHYNVFMRAALTAEETLLVHGGSGGIGTTAIQLARAKGATVVTTAGTDEKCRFCERLGAAHAINYRETDWEEALYRHLGDQGVNVVLDMVGGAYMQKNIDVLARDGRYVIIAFLEGSKAALDLGAVLARRLTITGSTLRPQSIEEKAAIRASLEADARPLLESGAVAPVLHATFPLADAGRAHALMESSRHIGKIVLTVQQAEDGAWS